MAQERESQSLPPNDDFSASSQEGPSPDPSPAPAASSRRQPRNSPSSLSDKKREQAEAILLREWDPLTLGRVGAEMLATMGVMWPEMVWPDLRDLGREIYNKLFLNGKLRGKYTRFGYGQAEANRYLTSYTIAANLAKLAACDVLSDKMENK